VLWPFVVIGYSSFGFGLLFLEKSGSPVKENEWSASEACHAGVAKKWNQIFFKKFCSCSIDSNQF
jgi:hypothetical protein